MRGRSWEHSECVHSVHCFSEGFCCPTPIRGEGPSVLGDDKPRLGRRIKVSTDRVLVIGYEGGREGRGKKGVKGRGKKGVKEGGKEGQSTDDR